jgi:hypothetical protein
MKDVVTSNTGRDRTIDDLLRRTLGERGDDGSSPSCLDAETCAAWSDGGLRDAERARVETHVADCARCQAMLAALTRASVASAAARPWWLRGRNLGWMVPLAAGAAALALWVAVPDREIPSPAVSRLDRASESAGPGAEPKAATSAAERDSGTSTRAPAPAASPLRAPALSRSVAGARKEADTAVAAAKDERQEQRTPSSTPPSANDNLTKTAAPPPSAAPAAPPPEQAAQPASAFGAAQAPAARARNFESAVSSDKALDSSNVTGRLQQASAPVRWRLGSAGVVQRSPDSGATWEDLRVGATSELLAVSSPSALVCWVAGRSGAVFLTTDGRRFVRLPFPTTVDLSVIRATDAKTATVTTADGRTFRTDDGGMTWSEGR